MTTRTQRALATGFVLVQLLGIVQAADADLQAARQSATAMQGSLQTFTQTNIGTVDTSFVQNLGSQGMTPAANAAANNNYIATCTTAAENGYVGVSNQQKLECQATITAAQITHTKDPYLDPNNPDAATLIRQVKDRDTAAAAQVTTGAVTAPSSITATTSNCQQETTPLPAIQRSDRCHVERPVSGAWVDEPVSVALAPDPPLTTKAMAFGTVLCSKQDAPNTYAADEPFCPAGGGGGDLVVTMNTAGLATYDANPRAEKGDLVCIETTNVIVTKNTTVFVTVPPVSPATEPTQTTQVITTQSSSGVCTRYRQGYDIWDTAAPWDESRCAQLDANTSCAFTGYKSTKSIGGADVWADKTFSCQMTPAGTASMGTGCQTSLCVGDTCMDVSSSPNAQFGQAAVGLEMLREAGVYAKQDPASACPASVTQYLAQCNPQVGACPDATGLLYLQAYPQCGNQNPAAAANLRIFSGIADSCKRPTGPGFGSNCCNSSSGTPLKANRQVVPSVAFSAAYNVVKAAGSYGISQASPYVYDFMFSSNGQWLEDKAWGLMGSGVFDPGAGFSPSLSMYGFTLSGTGAGGAYSAAVDTMFGSDSAISAGLNLFGSEGVAWDSGALMGSDMVLYFNPYVLIAMIVIQIIMDLYSCDTSEKMLATRRGGQLCEKVGETCSQRIPIVKTCIQITETWCCWNSRLAHLIAVQGGVQLGGGPRCGGFTPEEISQLDFSKIDLSQFMAEVMSNVSLPDGTYLSSMAQQGVNQATVAVGSVKPAAQAAAVSDPNLVDYSTGRIQMMLAK